MLFVMPCRMLLAMLAYLSACVFSHANAEVLGIEARLDCATAGRDGVHL